MSGVLNVLVASDGGHKYTVTIGNSSSFYGYNDPAGFGSISSSDFRGETILTAFSGTQVGSQNDLQLSIDGEVDQFIFSRIVVQTTADSYRTLLSSDAAFSVALGTSFWTWDTNTPVWTSTSPSSREMIIYV